MVLWNSALQPHYKLVERPDRASHNRATKHSAEDVVAKAQAVLWEAELLRAMFDVGYFPPNTPPPVE
jgi:hypothetical protein